MSDSPPPIGISHSFQHCPKCGTPAQTSGAHPFHCHACEFVYYFGPTAAVGAIVADAEGRVLLTRRARDPGAGKLGMPGGFIDPEETAESALEREVQEELGLTVISSQFLITVPNQYNYRGFVIPVLDLYYQCQVDGLDEIQFTDGEVADCFFATIDDPTLEQLAFTANRRALEIYRKQMLNHKA